MDYRDDREALHHHVAQLEEELATAHRQGKEEGLGAAAELEAKIARMRGELETMSAEVQQLRAGKAARPALPALAIVGGVVALGGVLLTTVVVLTTRSAVHVDTPPAILLPPPTVASVLPALTIPPPDPIPVVPVQEPKRAPRTTKARWTASVTRADGLGLAAGTPCTIDATLSTSGTNVRVSDLEMSCGKEPLYSSADGLNGMSESSDDAREVLGTSDVKSSFTLQYRDLGTRTGKRTQIDLDSNKFQGSAFRETIPRFRVDFSLQPNSLPTTPLADADHRLRKTGKVTHVTGAAPVKEGASCTVRAIPTGSDTECVADLTCGTAVLWSPRSAVACTYENASPTGITTADGPTNLTLDDSTLTLKTKTYELGIDLTE